MERSPRKRPEPAAIDITWVSCRGVRSSLPFHTPCLYAAIFVTPSSVNGHHRPHRVKTPTDRAGGGNPEWDTPLRLYLPSTTSPPTPPPEAEAKADKKNDDVNDDDVLVLRFEIKAEVAVLGDMLAASAAVAVPDLVHDGRTRRVSYQLVGPDGRSPNGVISFSYAFHDRNAQDDDDGRSSDGELVVTSPCPVTLASTNHVARPAPATTAAPRLYPAIEWPLEDAPIIYPPPVTAEAAGVTANSRYYPPPPSATPPEPAVAVYPPPAETSGMYPTVDLAPVSCYPPAAPPLYGVECGYATAPGWDHRFLYG